MKRLLLRGSAVGVVVIDVHRGGPRGRDGDSVEGRRCVGKPAAKAADSSRNAATRQHCRDRPPVDMTDTAARPPAPNIPAAPPAFATPSTPGAPTRDGVATRPAPPLVPVLPMGQSELPDGVTAIRGDSDVVVSFDLMMTRTRKPEKFEQFVRATLPVIYGRGVRDVLSKIPDGGLSGQGDLLTELPKRGMRIPVGSEWMIRLFPETRPGQDGPLVVRYRVSVVPSGD